MQRLATGNSELDTILHGGLPTGSFVVVAGPPGSGKSLLAHQIAFANASSQHPAHYYSSMSESQSKMKRHLQDFAFFDDDQLGTAIRLVQLKEFAEHAEDDGGALEAVVDEIVAASFRASPAVVIVDSSRSLEAYGTPAELRAATFALASKMSHSGAVLLYIGEYDLDNATNSPEFAVADVILELTNQADMARDRRTIRVAKLRGSGFIGGQHPFTISTSGLEVCRRLESDVPAHVGALTGRAAFGEPQLDAMTGGGIPRGDVAVVLGPSGTGKTTLALQWVQAALARTEPALYVALEENPAELIEKADGFGHGFGGAIDRGLLQIVRGGGLRDLDEVGHDIRTALATHQPRVVVVDAISSLLPTLRQEGRTPGYQSALAAQLHDVGATALFVHEVRGLGTGVDATEGLSTMANDVILLRYMERGSELGRVLSVLKMRRSDHDKGLLQFDITNDGFTVTGEAAGVRHITGWTVLGGSTAD